MTDDTFGDKKSAYNFSDTYDDFTDKQVDDTDGSENTEHLFDSKASFLENYKSLSPSQIKGLNSDTKELIKTQKSLIETLKNMGPTLKEGKNVLDTFKNYFGKDGDLGMNLKNL